MTRPWPVFMVIWYLFATKSVGDGVGKDYRNGLVPSFIHPFIQPVIHPSHSLLFPPFLDKPLIGLLTNLVCSSEFVLLSWSLIDWAVSLHLQTNWWSDKIDIWWANALWASPDVIHFWSCSTDFFFLFPGHRSVKRFLCICRQTADQISSNLVGKIIMAPPDLINF